MLIRPGNDDLLLIIDVQNDFCPGGALAVADGDAVVPVINRLAERFDHIALTQDWHPPGHSSFATSHPGANPFDSVAMPYGQQTLWPDHCRQGTAGAAFHPELEIDRAELIIRKGFRSEIDSYSAFFENDRRTPTGLAGYLRDRGLRRIFLVGLPPIFASIIPPWTRAGSASTPCLSRVDAGLSIWRARSTPPGQGWPRPACSVSAIFSAANCYAVRVVRFGIPPAAMISALKTSIVVRCRIAVCRMSANASVSDIS